MSSVQYAESAQDFEIEMTSANTEYALELPSPAKGIEMQCRDGTAFRHSFTEGAVDTATPPGPYQTVHANVTYRKDNLFLNGHTLYVACGTAAKVVDVRVWL